MLIIIWMWYFIESDSCTGFNLVPLSLFVYRDQICRSPVRAGTAEERVHVCP